MRSILYIIFLLANFSCGILGIYNDDINLDPEHQAKLLDVINSSPLAKRMDSLIRQIDSADVSIPADLHQTVLVVETYDNYSDFLRMGENKFRAVKDDKKERKAFKRYQERKTLLLKKPNYPTVYMSKNEYEAKDLEAYRCILRTTVRLEYDPMNIKVTNDGFVYPCVGTLIYYIIDRKTGKVFRQVDLSMLSN